MRPRAPDRPLRVLVADDHPDAADTLADLVRLHGCDAIAAHGGAEAIELASAHPPDLAILDLLMPVVSGFAVARALGRLPAPPLLVALTGSDGEDVRQLAGEAGFDVYLLKPADLDALLMIFDAAGRRGPAPA